MTEIVVGAPQTCLAAQQRRVLVLATTFPASPGDGTPEFVLTLSAALARTGADVTVVAPRVRGATCDEEMSGVRVRRFPYFLQRWEDLADGAIMPNLRERPWRILQVLPLLVSFQLATLRAVRTFRPQVIHAHWIVPAGVVARLTQVITRTPYVITAHGADVYTLRSGLPLRLKKRVVRRAVTTVPVSRAISEKLAGFGEVSSPLPMGVDVARIRGEVGARTPEAGRVLFVGRLVDKKGVDVLIRAAAQVPAVRLAIAGDGPLAHDLAALVDQLELATRVEFLGHCTRGQVMEQLARAAIVALPSKVGADGDQDGVPVVLAEAMAAGVPVVASALGGLGEHVADGVTGRVVSPGSVEQLALALDQLVKEPAAAEELAATASERIAETLDIERIAESYREVLDAAVRSSRNGACR